MFDHSSFLAGVLGLIDNLLSVYLIVILARVIISWVSPDPDNRIVQILRGFTDPPLNALRRRLPAFLWSSGLDFTPLIFILLIQVVQILLRSIHL